MHIVDGEHGHAHSHHTHEHTHEYTHSHEHAHEHGHEHEHTHEHEEHAHCHDHAHEHAHDHGHDHEHGEHCGCCSCQHEHPVNEQEALLAYMLDHNKHHAAELLEMAKQLRACGKEESAVQIEKAVENFDKGNLYLSLALSLVK